MSFTYLKGGNGVDLRYYPAMQAASDWRRDVRAALDLEAATLDPAEVAILHRG
jgi:hypothetical protein